MTDTEIVPWRVLSRELALDASPWLRCWVETVQLPTGKTVEGFYKLRLPDYAVIFAITGIVVFAVHSSVGEYVWFFILIGFIFIIPRAYRSASRGDALERRLNRSGYRRPGFGPRR